jgi:alpha-D-xyloside xylohydrolase
MGQYQQPFLDLKNCTLELAQRNSRGHRAFCPVQFGLRLSLE